MPSWGEFRPEKRPDRAIRMARAAGILLKIAAKVDKVDEEYFRNDILPLIDGPGVEFIGEINEREERDSSARQPLCCFRWIGRSHLDS